MASIGTGVWAVEIDLWAGLGGWTVGHTVHVRRGYAVGIQKERLAMLRGGRPCGRPPRGLLTGVGSLGQAEFGCRGLKLAGNDDLGLEQNQQLLVAHEMPFSFEEE